MFNPLVKSNKNCRYRSVSCEMIVKCNRLLMGGHWSCTSSGNNSCLCFVGHFGTSWVKHYCTYQRESKRITMVPFDQKSGGKGVSADRQRGCVPGLSAREPHGAASSPSAQTDSFLAR